MSRAVAILSLVAVALAGLATAAVLADSVTLQAKRAPCFARRVQRGRVGRDLERRGGRVRVVEGKECGIPGAFFRGLGGATTLAGGRFEASVPIRTKTTLRAEWNEAASPTVVVTPRANVRLTKEADGFRVSLTNDTESADGKKVTIERLTGTGWKKLQTVVLKAQPGLRPVRGEEEAPFQGAEGHDYPRGAAALAGGRLLPGRIQQAHPNVEEAA